MKDMITIISSVISLMCMLPSVSMSRGPIKASRGFSKYNLSKETWGGLSGSMMSAPITNRDGTKIYCCYERGRQEKRWDPGTVSFSSFRVEALANTERDEYAARPSLDESKLLVLCEKGEELALVVTDMKVNDLAEIAVGLDLMNSQFFWGAEGKEVYYTIPAESGNGMCLRIAGADGKGQKKLVADGVHEFDYCLEKDRLVIRRGKKLLVFNSKKSAGEIELPGAATREYGLRTLCLSRDGRKLAVGGDDLRILNLEDRNRIIAKTQASDGDTSRYYMIAWLPDGSGVLFDQLDHWGSREGPALGASIQMLSLDGKGSEILRNSSSLHPYVLYDKDGDEFRFMRWELWKAEPVELCELPEPSDMKPAYKEKWQASNGPYGGRINDFEVASSDSDHVYAIINQALYRTEDAGETWKTVQHDGINRIRDVAVDPNDCMKLYGVVNGKVMLSADGGETWEKFGPEDRERRFTLIESHPKKSGTVIGLLTDQKTVARVEKGSITILGSMDEEADYPRLHVDYHNPDLITVGDSYLLHRFSTDGGKTWKKLKLPKCEERFVYLSGDPSREDLIYAEMHSGRAFFSDNGGKSWELFADPADKRLWTKEIVEQVEMMFPLQASSADPGFVEGYKLGQENLAVAGPKNRDRVYMPVHSTGLYRSDDGGKTWKPANKKLGLTDIYQLHVLGNGRIFATVTGSQWMTSEDNCESWRLVQGPWTSGGNIVAAHPTIDGLLLIADSRSRLFRSEDWGETWETISGPVIPAKSSSGKCFRFDAKDRKHITLLSASGILDSADAGKNWELKSEYEVSDTHSIIVANEKVIYCRLYGDARIFKSADMAKTWSVVQGPYLRYGTGVMLVRPDKPEVLYVVSTYVKGPSDVVIWVTEDFGETWEGRGIPKSDRTISSIVRNPVYPDMLAIGFKDVYGVWLSRDDGRTWMQCGTGLPQLTREEEAKITKRGGWTPRQVRQLEFSRDGKRLYAFVTKEGLFWIDLPQGD